MDGTKIPKIVRMKGHDHKNKTERSEVCRDYIQTANLKKWLKKWLRGEGIEKPSEALVAYYLEDGADLRRPWEEVEAIVLSAENRTVRNAWKAFQQFGPEEALFTLSFRKKKWKS